MLPKSLSRFLVMLAIVFALDARADLLDQVNDALSLQDDKHQFHLQLSGLLDFESYYIDQRAPGLLESDRGFLLNPRLSIFLDVQLTKHFYFFGQARIDRGFDPSDGNAQVRLDEYVLRYTPFDARFNIQIGKFATVVGNWVSRHFSWDNPFINAPLPYENITGIWDSEAPEETEDFLYWGHVGEYETGDYSDKYLRLPVIWGPSYTTGLAVTGTIGKFDYAGEIKNSALASRPESWDATEVGFDHPTFSGRVGFRPNEMWNVGFSVSSGPYLLPVAAPTLPLGRDIGDYRQLLLGQDVSFAWHHFQLWAEFFETRFEVPNVGDADVFSYYLEAKYKITPQLFVALRWNQQLFGEVKEIEEEEGGGQEIEWNKWGNDVWRVDAAVGYRFTNYLQAKVQYSFTRTDAPIQVGEQMVAVQITLKF